MEQKIKNLMARMTTDQLKKFGYAEETPFEMVQPILDELKSRISEQEFIDYCNNY